MTRAQYFAMCAIGLVAIAAYFRAEQIARIIAGKASTIKKPQTVNA